ncbi:MAG TPA: Ig-like domain-containing protein, partial [Candidatus Angelobacter sp.]
MPPTFTYPGVYIEEIPSGVHTITGVATSIAAFVGWAPQGPTDKAVLVQSWSDFASQFGGLDARSYLGYAVSHFFANGGQQAFIVRLVWDGTLPAAPGTNPTAAATAVAAGVGYGSTQIQASVGTTVSPAATLFVGTAVLQSIAITPANLPPIPINVSVQFTATGTSSNSTTKDITSSVHWSSSDNTVIKIAPGGLATPSGPGTATITAKDPTGLISGTLTVTVSAASLSGIAVAPSAPALAAGQTQQLAATGSYSDGTTQDLTAITTWAPSADFASPGPPGLFVGSASASVTAAWGSVTSPAVSVTVGPKTLVSIVITPSNLTLSKGQTASTPFTATPIYSDGSTAPAISPSWTSSNPTVATLDGTEHAVANNVGSTTITATSGSISASTTVNVTAATLNSISVTPAALSIANGQSQQLQALGIYSDGSTADLTGSASWAATGGEAGDVDVASSRVTVKNGVVTVASGLVTGKSPTAPGTPVPVNAAWEGKTGTAQVTVTPAVLQSIAITPTSATILGGQTQQFTAKGTFSDGTTQSPLAPATWTSTS